MIIKSAHYIIRFLKSGKTGSPSPSPLSAEKQLKLSSSRKKGSWRMGILNRVATPARRKRMSSTSDGKLPVYKK